MVLKFGDFASYMLSAIFRTTVFCVIVVNIVFFIF